MFLPAHHCARFATTLIFEGGYGPRRTRHTCREYMCGDTHSPWRSSEGPPASGWFISPFSIPPRLFRGTEGLKRATAWRLPARPKAPAPPTGYPCPFDVITKPAAGKPTMPRDCPNYLFIYDGPSRIELDASRLEKRPSRERAPLTGRDHGTARRRHGSNELRSLGLFPSPTATLAARRLIIFLPGAACWLSRC